MQEQFGAEHSYKEFALINTMLQYFFPKTHTCATSPSLLNTAKHLALPAQYNNASKNTQVCHGHPVFPLRNAANTLHCKVQAMPAKTLTCAMATSSSPLNAAMHLAL